MTCSGADCGTELGPADLLCGSCGRPRPRAAHTAGPGRPLVRPPLDQRDGPRTGRFRLVAPWGEFPIGNAETDIGREVGPLAAELAGYPAVSRRHAALRITDSGRLHVIDHNSTNGTFKNDRRIEAHIPVELCDHDTVSFSTRLRLDVRVDDDISLMDSPLATRTTQNDTAAPARPATRRPERLTPPDTEATTSPPTFREDDTPPITPTLRESSSSGAAARFGLASLPDELDRSYRLVRQLAASGGEATLFEVAEIGADETRVLKIYRRHVTLRDEALRRIQSIDPAHVVTLVDHGRLEDGRWYEVQERIDAGNLVDYRSRAAPEQTDLEDVVAELAAAIAAFHRAGLAHHDIKPENVLVRSTSPLDLVLGDFGLSVVSDNRTYYATNRNATIAYQAPETMRQVGGGARDYWALGLTVAMLATGDAPYAGINEHAILDQHYHRIPPGVVESMPEGRLKQLCRGLTRYDPASRWSEQEVRLWLAGGSPAVLADASREPPDGARLVHFNDKRFTVPSALAREMMECWSLAAETIGARGRREKFADELILAFGTEPLAKLIRRWSEAPPRRDRIDPAIVELLLILDPEAPAMFRSRPLDADTLAAAALGDSDEDARFVADLLDRGLLAAWSHGAGHAALGDIDRRWREELGTAAEIISEVEAAGAAAPPIGVWAAPLLAVCARSELLDEWQRQRPPRPFGDLMPGWYEQMADGSRPAEVIGSVLLASEARRVQRNAVEARRRQQQEDERLRRDLKYRVLLSLLGWTTAVAFIGSWLLELVQIVFTDYWPQPGAGLIVYVIAFVLFRQWRNAAGDRRRARESRGEAPATEAHEIALAMYRRWRAARSSRRREERESRHPIASALFRWLLGARARALRSEASAVPASSSRDDLSAGRRAEAYGIGAFVLVVEWARNTSISPPLVRLAASGSLDSVTMLQDGYKLAGLSSLAWSVASFLHRRNEDPPTVDQIQRLRAADRRTLKRTLIWTLVWLVSFGMVSFLVPPGTVWELLASVWVPAALGGLSLLVRGRWPHRRTGARWAVVLLAVSAAALLSGLLL